MPMSSCPACRRCRTATTTCRSRSSRSATMRATAAPPSPCRRGRRRNGRRCVRSFGLLGADRAGGGEDVGRPADDIVIVGRRHMRSNNSWMHSLPLLAKGPNRCTALVHPSDAARLGLAHGGKAHIRGQRGSMIEAEVQVSDEMMPGVVSVPHGWGHDMPGTRLGVASERPGANLNAVLDESLLDPLSGNAVLGGVPVTVTPA